MKILLIVGHDGIYSGASYQALYLALGLKDRDHEVHCVWGPEGGDASLDIVGQAGLKLHTLSMQGKFNFKAIQTLRRLFKAEHFDVVHCFKGMAMYRALWASTFLQIPVLVFNREVSKPLEYFQGSKYRSRRVDRVIADSQAVKQILIQSGGLAANRISVVYDEVDLERYHRGVDGAAVRREFGAQDGDFWCAVIGNWAPWRGQEHFLRAAAQIQKAGASHAHIKFLLVGKETDCLKPLAQELGIAQRLQFTGFRSDLERVIAALDLVVNCSVAVESLSGAITIAMAMGKPVVGTAIAGTPELVEEGVTGFLVPPADAEKMAEAILKIASLPPAERNRMGERARKKMEEDFSRQGRAAKMEQIYLDIMASKKTAGREHQTARTPGNAKSAKTTGFLL